MRVLSEDDKRGIITGEYSRVFPFLWNVIGDILISMRESGKYGGGAEERTCMDERAFACDVYRRGFSHALDVLDLYEDTFKEKYKAVLRNDIERGNVWDGSVCYPCLPPLRESEVSRK